ncbi:hypothetical protein HVTV-2_gp161 [Haloarcula virus HVTV-2]|uniref:Uncharacterized protein n=1 Tax=Haloarcula vallismortis tailed virus 1 TaxID=1262528 RepID=L7TJG8_9CAUD|nr:hypothetical protein HVTV1_159 [Haloarcula vallismortis tailed virus 1]AGC34528.1 hypothetical protein HVTV1_159 [Haloarcula vallismortis tailed virus 1]UBF22968.1 hypothetical protein HVTV-2_gp161 [Haloarcula virus HVTV-2]
MKDPEEFTFEEKMESWETSAYVTVGVPHYYLPATEMDPEVNDGVTELKAPIGTREQLAGAWYGHRATTFWNERFAHV